jgi:hypothetical protein
MRSPLLSLALSLTCLCAFSRIAAQKEAANVLGEWQGESKCTVLDSPCNNEHVLYKITRTRNSRSELSLAAYKGPSEKGPSDAREFMGTLLCHLESSRATLTCTAHTAKHEEWIFQIDGDSMVGTLTIDPDKLIYRRVNVSRKGPQ